MNVVLLLLHLGSGIEIDLMDSFLAKATRTFQAFQESDHPQKKESVEYQVRVIDEFEQGIQALERGNASSGKEILVLVKLLA